MLCFFHPHFYCHELWNSHEIRRFLFKWSGTESLKQTAADTWIAVSARMNSAFIFQKTPLLLVSHSQTLLILLDRGLVSVDTITINMLLNKYSHMRSMKEDDFTRNKLLGVIYVLLHCSLWVVPGPHKSFEVAAGIQLAHSLPGHGTVRDAAWRSMKALINYHKYLGTQDPGSLTDLLPGSTANLVSRKASGWPSKGSLDRMLSVSRQMLYIQQAWANPFLYILTQERAQSLPGVLGSKACIRQSWDETLLGEWMSWQMLSAGNLLKSQLVRGYRSCSVEHS